MRSALSLSRFVSRFLGFALIAVLTLVGVDPHCALSNEGPRVSSDAFFISPSGDDNNPGSFDRPFATLERAQDAMRNNATRKTVYLRAGIYKQMKTLQLTAEDDGQKWSFYPPEGYNTAVLDASEMPFSACRNSNVIFIQGGSRITIDGLRIRSFKRGGGITIHGGPAYPDIRAGGCFVYGRTRPAHDNIVSNNIIHDVGDGADNRYPWGWFAGIAAWGDVKNTTINNNVVYDVGGVGILIGLLQAGPKGGLDGASIRNNAVYNTNRAPKAGDLGGYYVIDRTATSTGIVLKNNYLRDYGDPTRRIKGLYLDDGASNVEIRGNLVLGSGTWAVQIHGGNRNRIAGNIFDLGNSDRQWVLLYQNASGRRGTANMTGNVFETNLIVADVGSTAGLDGSVYYSGYSPKGFEYPAVRSNIYWNYRPGIELPHQGDIRDASPQVADPKLGKPFYKLDTTSPVYALPAPFPRQPDDWGKPGFWGPPGYLVPKN